MPAPDLRTATPLRPSRFVASVPPAWSGPSPHRDTTSGADAPPKSFRVDGTWVYAITVASIAAAVLSHAPFHTNKCPAVAQAAVAALYCSAEEGPRP